jgi:hypothetical protein
MNDLPESQSDTPSVTSIPAKKAKTTGANEPDYGRRHYRVQLAAVFVGAVVAVIYGCQLNEMRKSTNAATSAANSAKKSLEQIERNAHLDQRAWVAPDLLDGKAELGKPYTITILIKNTGKTFANHFIGFVGWTTIQISDPDPDFDSLLIAEGVSNQSVILLSPNGGGVTQSLTIPKGGSKLTDDDIQNFNDPTRIFFFFGKLTYSDIFKCTHWTTFCYRAFPNTGIYRVHYSHNNADENECSESK